MKKFNHTLLRLVAFSLAVLLILSCAACGKKKDKAEETGKDEITEEVTPSAPDVETDGIITDHKPPVQTNPQVPEIKPEGQNPPENSAGSENQPSQNPDNGAGSQSPETPPQPEVNDPPAVPESPPVNPPSVNGSTDIAGNYSVSSANLAETADMGQAYVDSMVFLGDSTTYGLKYYGMLSGGSDTMQVWTPTSGTLTLSYQSVATIYYPETGEEIPIREAAARKQPEYLVITLGVNGVSFMDEAYFKSEYTALVRGIQQASPNTKIILQSIFPVASDYQYISSINNVKIAAANQWVIEIAEETGTKYLATSSALIGSDGFLPGDYQNGDGLHLNPTSFSIVLNYIRTHGYR